MHLAHRKQHWQDWATQQWNIACGRKFDPKKEIWLAGPYGQLGGIGEKVLQQLADSERLLIQNTSENSGLLPNFQELELPAAALAKLHPSIVDFYQNTASYALQLKVKWNPFFRFFGKLVHVLFSRRIEQLSLPLTNSAIVEPISSELIQLVEPESGKLRYTFWLRKFSSSEQVLYSGCYSTCKLPDGQTCVKAVFPLPMGNATVIMRPSVGENGELILRSAGKKMGDAGFYFLLQDAKAQHWAHFIACFRDELTVKVVQNQLVAFQQLTLWGFTVVEFEYRIAKK